MKKRKEQFIYYVMEGILIIIVLFLFIYGLIHPRPYIWTIIFTLVMFVISLHLELKKIRAGKIKEIKTLRYFLGIPIGLYIAYAVGDFGTLLWPKHMPWEYKGDIQTLKEESPERYYFFPDELPESATEVEWVMCPGMMQGTPYEYLEFYADRGFLQKVISQYEDEARMMVYDTEYNAWPVFVKDLYQIEEDRREFVKLYVIYQSPDAHRFEIRGFWTDEEKGLIRYFRE